MNAKKYFMEKIGFLKWARVEGYWQKEAEGISNCIISPDVHSLHLAWEESDGAIGHEIADYPYEDMTEEEILEWVENEIADDTWQLYNPGEMDLLEAASDYGKDIEGLDELPVITIRS